MIPSAKLRQSKGQIATCRKEIEVSWFSFGKRHLLVEVVSIVIDMTDIDYDKELIKVLPKHEEDAIIFIRVTKVEFEFS